MTAAQRTPVERVVDALAARGCEPKPAGAHQWTARCPVTTSHKRGDRTPSLSLGESPNGKALLTCHRGCTVPEIAAALELAMRDLFPEDGPQPSAGDHKARYGYHDEDGELLYEVVKIVTDEGKTFRQRRPDGNGGWIWNLQGVRRVIYHLPQVVAAVREGRPVVICEGEKDAETAAWMWADVRAATTCNPFGAGADKWKSEYDEWFRGADVTIVADDDPVGRLHADTIRTHLAGVAANVTVMLPAEPHKDLSEMWGVGLGRDALRPLTAATTAGVEPAEAMRVFVDWSEFWRTEHPAEDWLIEPLVPRGRAVALYAPAKAGKSLVVLSAVVPAVIGAAVWNAGPQPPIRALYLDYEMTESDLRERLEMLGYGPETDLSGLAYALIPILPPLDTPDGGQRVLELALAHGADLVVVDTLGRAATGDENDADTMRAWYRCTGALLKSHGIAVIRTDHAGKDVERGQRGSSAKNDDVDVVWRLERLQDGLRLVRTHSRMMWVPETLLLDFTENDDGVWTMRRHGEMATWPAGTKEAATALDELGVPLSASARTAFAALREAGRGMKNTAVRAGVKWRRQEAARLGRDLISVGRDAGRGTNPHNPVALPVALDDDAATSGFHPGSRRDAPAQSPRPAVPPPKGGRGADPAGAIDPLDELFGGPT